MPVYTQYDSDLKEKVFVVRGSERYNQSTLCNLSYTYAANRRSYLALNLTATVQHHKSKSSVAFYDNGTLLGLVDIKSSQSSVSLNAQVGYGSHQIYAKYLGNNECLSSKSRYEELTVLEPDLPTPTFVVTDFDKQSLTSTSTFTVGLDVNGTYLSDRSVMVYVDDELYSTETISDLTVISIDNMDIGSHDIKLVFEGDDEYLACEYENTIWTGYDLDAQIDYANIVVGNTVNVEAYLHDFGGAPIVGETINLQVHSALTLFGATDENGYVHFEVEIDRILTHLNVIHTDSNSYVSIPISVVTIQSIDMEADSTITASGNDTIIRVTPRLANGNAVPNLLVNVNGTDMVTDNSGVAEYVHTGTGAGLVTITATNNDVSNSIELEDCVRYWTPDRKLGWVYSIVKQLTVTEQTNGLLVSSSNNGNGQLYFRFDEGKTCNWSLEFKVKYMNIINEFYGGSFQTCFMNTQSKWNVGTPVKVVKQGNQTTLYIDGAEVRSSTNSVTFIPSLILSNASVLITDVKLMRL